MLSCEISFRGPVPHPPPDQELICSDTHDYPVHGRKKENSEVQTGKPPATPSGFG